MGIQAPLYIPSQPYIPEVSRTTRQPKQNAAQAGNTQPHVAFDDVLQETVDRQERVRFSAHAQERARTRNLSFNEGQLARLEGGVQKVASKGAREALVLVDNVAAVVNVGNKTVITVADTSSLNDNVFTGIDSAVIA